MRKRPAGSADRTAAALSPQDVRERLARKRGRERAGSCPPLLVGTSVFASLLGTIVFAGCARFFWRWWTTPRDYKEVLQLPELNAKEPGATSTFFEKYHGRLPVVIHNALQGWPAREWNTSILAGRCPKARLPVYKYELETTEWAALRQDGDMAFVEYLDLFFGRSASKTSQSALYGLEMSLRTECPVLLEDVRIPAFFSDDLLMRYYKKPSWPTLIAGAQGTRSGLHRDTHDFPFWMAMLKGRKRWRIFLSSEDALAPLYHPERNGFIFDPFQPDFYQYPSLGEARVYEHVLEPGQLIYIPNGAPHAAQNVEDALALSGNYLDKQSLQRHLEVTCKQKLWEESNLCWGYTSLFEGHKALALENLRELSYFEHADTPGGPAAWCKMFLPDLQDRAQRREELQRNVPIVEEYCASRGYSSES